MRADQRFYILIILGIVEIFIISWNVLLPSLKTYVQIINSFIQSSNLHEQKQEIEMEIKEIEERNSYFIQQIDQFKSQLFTFIPLSDFYHLITRLVEENNLKILSRSPNVMGLVTTLELRSFQFYFSAGLLAIMRFIAQVGEQGVLLQITELVTVKKQN